MPVYPWLIVPVQIGDGWIEFEPPDESGTYVLRLPIGRDERAAADKVVQHFRDRVQPSSG